MLEMASNVHQTDSNQKRWSKFLVGKGSSAWLKEKQKVDDTDGLWRVHDNLYDVTSFMNKHPGGKFWLEVTQGTDITELFEAHHIKSDLPEQTLKKFFVKKAVKPRLSAYTFHEDGFYRTIKRKVRVVLQTLPKNCTKLSNIYTDSLLLTTVLLACLANVFFTYSLLILASLSCSFLLIATHNYTHQRDNFRMFYGELFMMSLKQFRIVHVLSHHMFPNSKTDLHITLILPVVNVFPEKKSFAVKYLAWISSHFLLFPFILHIFGTISIIETLIHKTNYKNIILPFVIPLAMYCTGSNTLLATIGTWQIMLITAGSIISMLSFTTTHVHPDLYVEGDAMRPKNELDWGLCQLDTVFDRKEILGNQFLSLVTFGDHALHHLFPSLDQGYLKYLYPVLEETLKEFNVNNINITTTVDLYLGFFKQATRDAPKTSPPYLGKVY